MKTFSACSVKNGLAAISQIVEGTNGRGFAVVANKVRNLANRVQEAIQEVHANVEEMTKQVQNINVRIEHSENMASESQFRIEQAVHELFGMGKAARQLDTQAKTLVYQLQG